MTEQQKQKTEPMELDPAHVHFRAADLSLVTMIKDDGTELADLEPRRLFPLSNREEYIILLDGSGCEQGILPRLDALAPDDRAVLSHCLSEYYMMPKITAVYACREKFGLLRMQAQTDRGPTNIEVRNVFRSVKLQGTRVLLRDSDDNRYEIPDVRALDRRSRALLEPIL